MVRRHFLKPYQYFVNRGNKFTRHMDGTLAILCRIDRDLVTGEECLSFSKQNSDNGFVRSSYLPWDTNGHLQNPSNVTRICRAVQRESDDGIMQITYYQAGIGTEAGFLDHIYGGGTGAGLSENIREAYAFIVKNHKPKDEIFLIGFSRGAFTARSIAGLIGCVGLLTIQGMSYFYHIFKEWENQYNTGYRSIWIDRPPSLPDRMQVAAPAYAQELEKV